MIKTSPLIDLIYGINAFRFVLEIHVVAVKHECKEILWILGREQTSLCDTPQITCATLSEQGSDLFKYSLAEAATLPPTQLHQPLTYLYEPARKSVATGKCVSVRVVLGCRRTI